jgi:hypothetical protein
MRDEEKRLMISEEQKTWREHFFLERIRSVFLAMGSGSTFFFSQQCVAKLKKPRFLGQINSVIENAKKVEQKKLTKIRSNQWLSLWTKLQNSKNCWSWKLHVGTTFYFLQLLCACCSLLCFLFYTPSPFINTARHLHLQKMKISQRTWFPLPHLKSDWPLISGNSE